LTAPEDSSKPATAHEGCDYDAVHIGVAVSELPADRLDHGVADVAADSAQS
jgi:hypothetical protein